MRKNTPPKNVVASKEEHSMNLRKYRFIRARFVDVFQLHKLVRTFTLHKDIQHKFIIKVYCALLYLTYMFKWQLSLIFHAVSLNYLQNA